MWNLSFWCRFTDLNLAIRLELVEKESKENHNIRVIKDMENGEIIASQILKEAHEIAVSVVGKNILVNINTLTIHANAVEKRKSGR